MGTPEGKNYAASLLDFAGKGTARLVRQYVPTDLPLLDIGAGWMKYRILLNEFDMDAVEIWQPYVDKHRLHDFYDNVYVMAAVDFVYQNSYGAVILGDVLEHMSVEDAQSVITDACANADLVVVAVPFDMEQHAEEGNPFEEHVQADLNEYRMSQRYPELRLHSFDGRGKAIYVHGV